MNFTFLFSFLIYLINCQISVNDGDNLEYYINYTLIPPIGGKVKTYYFEPHYEVGTVDFIIYFSNRALSCTFECYDGNTLVDRFLSHYSTGLTHSLIVPLSKPSILRLQVTNLNHEDPYYLYMYNNNYTIPLSFPNYYLYQITVTGLNIQYKIKDLSEDINLKLEAVIEYPQYKDKLTVIINDGVNEYLKSFEETSSYNFELKKDSIYTLVLNPSFNSLFTNNTYFFITFGKEENFPLLFYENNILTYTTILSNNKWYIIDSINSIDNYNYYKFSIAEGYQGPNDKNLNIRIKRYNTYDINFIKNNIPSSVSEYNENYILKNDNSLTFKACENTYLNEKTILIYIELNYNSVKSSLYKYSLQKIIENKQLEFKSYDINWYTSYEFSPIDVQNKDIIFISSNHSNTVFPQSSGNYKIFNSFYNGHLFVSYLNEDLNKNQVKIIYSDEGAKKENDDDIGHLELFKFDNEKMTFEVVNINELIESKIYSYELRKNYDKYFYIKINHKENYYLFYEDEDNYSFLTIEQMPIDIIKFSQNNTKSNITLMSYNNEYILKMGYIRPVFKLLNLFILKNENSRTLNLEEGQIKMITYPFSNSDITLYINIIEEKITNEAYVNLKIPSKKYNDNLYILTSDKIFILNNTGINIYNTNKDNQIILTIKNNDNISEDIPILIKLGIQRSKIKYISDDDKYGFNYGQFGVIKYQDNKKINMKFKMSIIDISFYYYSIYLSEDFLNDTSSITSPELFDTITLNSKEYNFEIKTELELERTNYKYNNKNKINECLYLIFSFDGKVEVFMTDDSENEDEEDEENNKSIYIIIFGIILPIIIIFIILILVFIYYKKNKKITNEENTPEKTSFIQSYEKPTDKGEYEQVVTDGYDNNEANVGHLKNIELENSKISKINNDSSYDPSQPAPLPSVP